MIGRHLSAHLSRVWSSLMSSRDGGGGSSSGSLPVSSLHAVSASGLASSASAAAAPSARSGVSDVERQVEAAFADASTCEWAAVKSGQWRALERHLLRLEAAGRRLEDVRGAVGETLLHEAYLYGHKAIAHELLAHCPRLVEAVYEGASYRGENVLHMAVAARDVAEGRFLLARCPELVHGRADGDFFHLGGQAYYGELPLGFAVCTNQPEFVTMLVREAGALISAGDEYGNTAAHLAVWHERLDMYALLEALWDRGYGRAPRHARVPLSAVRNADGQTPLVLAAALGKTAVFAALWERSRLLQWKWGNVNCHL